jgi:hypothetical protein
MTCELKARTEAADAPVAALVDLGLSGADEAAAGGVELTVVRVVALEDSDRASIQGAAVPMELGLLNQWLFKQRPDLSGPRVRRKLYLT